MSEDRLREAVASAVTAEMKETVKVALHTFLRVTTPTPPEKGGMAVDHLRFVSFVLYVLGEERK